MRQDPVLIVGTGALATLFAVRLSAIGVPVTMLGTWPAGLQALNTEGARLIDAKGITLKYKVRATADPRDCAGALLAVVLVKAWQTERAARQLAQCLAAEGLALTLQNGLGNDDLLVTALGKSHVALGVTTTGATLLGPGLARDGGAGRTSIEAHARLGPLAGQLRDAGFDVDIVPDARSLVWSKLVISVALNPLTALLRVPNGELLERPSARALMEALACEAASVAKGLGIPLAFPDPAQAVEEVARNSATNRSSMLQDVERGGRTEIDSICGAVARAGEQIGVPTPLNRTIWQLVSALAPA